MAEREISCCTTRPPRPPGRAPALGLGAGWVLGAFGSGRGKLAVLEAGLKVKVDVKLPLQRRRAAASISVEQLGFVGTPGTGSAESWRCWECFGGHKATLAEPRCSACQVLSPGTGDLSLFCSSSANAN